MIEDSGFGINSIKLIDNSTAIAETTSSLAILPSLHAVFASDGKDNEIREITSRTQCFDEYGEDFTDSKYGQQNKLVEKVLESGGTAYVCRLLPEDAKRAHLIFKVGIKPVDGIPLYKRDIYGEFVLDEDGNKIPLTYEETEEVVGEGGVPVSGTSVKKPITVSGYKLKLFVEKAPDSLINKYTSVQKLSEKLGEVSTDPETNYKVFPLFFMSYYANGKAGNDYGFRIINDFKRDAKVSDGRRYELFLVKKTSAGAQTLAIGNDLGFSFNPKARISQYVTSLEGLNTIYQNYSGATQKQIQMEVYTENYAKLQEYIEELLSQEMVINGTIDEDTKESLVIPTSMDDFDFINGYSLDGTRYDNVIVDNVRPYAYNEDAEIIKDDDGNPTYDETWVSSADVSVPKYMLGGTDGAFDTITSDEQLETTKADLLKKFFNCLIDTPRIANVLKCDAGITYDACYTPDIKRAMTKLLQNRRDICVVFDTMMSENLEEAVAMAKDIQSWIDPLDGGENYAIVPHCGITVDRAVNVRVTGTYEFAYGLTRLYRLAPFAIYAGKQNDYGCVRKTIFDWVIEESIPKGYQQKLAKKNKLYWATDLGKAVSSYAVGNDTERNVYFYSNASLYGESGSKLAEFRNGILCNDIRRMCKLILVKYTFDSDGAEAAIEKAKQEIFSVFKNRYPSNIAITYNLYQTDRDKKINEASCDINVVFPDVFETWNVKIVAGRNE